MLTAEDLSDSRRKVGLFERVRPEYEHGAGEARELAKKLGVHRRMLRQALPSAVPLETKRPRPIARFGEFSLSPKSVLACGRILGRFASGSGILKL